jgi:dienelactone hydrolase
MVVIAAHLFTISNAALSETAHLQQVRFDDESDSFEIVPVAHQVRTVGIIFYPGALVDPQAYAPKLASIVHATGIRVFIVKPPLRLADLNPGIASTIMKASPGITTWYVGGHSMGGAAACTFASRHPSAVQGLFLFASYCGSADRTYPGSTLAVTGTADPLEPLAKIRNRVPARTIFVQIVGADHASFGNYGSQPFDGTPTISNQSMTRALTTAMQTLLRSR